MLQKNEDQFRSQRGKRRPDCQTHWQFWKMAVDTHFVDGNSRHCQFMANIGQLVNLHKN